MGKGTSLNCASYIAGIIEGVLNSAKMYAKVTAHLYGENEDQNVTGSEESGSTTIYVIKFSKEVTAREK